MDERVIKIGIIEDIIFQNAENGFTVCSIKTEEDEEEITCVGVLPFVHAGESIKVEGSWAVHPTYGDQIRVEQFEKIVPETKKDIEKYLASGVVKGIGAKTAKKIVEHFGEKTLEIMEQDPQRLSEIKGISKKKALEVGESYHEQRSLRKVMMFLQQFGITPTYAVKIYKKFGEQTIEVVQENPYRLADEIFGIGFKIADRIAQKIGINHDSTYRICSGIRYVLAEFSGSGHVYMPRNELVVETAEMLGVIPELIEPCLIELQLQKVLVQERLEEEEAVYLSSFYYAELGVCKRLTDVYTEGFSEVVQELEGKIERIEQKNKIQLAENQKEAVRQVFSQGMLVITGGPGTGKTTTINTIIELLEQEGYEVLLAAPTGRAAKRMSEATGREARTIHRLLEINFLDDTARQQMFQKNEENPLEADVLIIDESSMIDILLMNSLLKAIAPGTKLILVGDVDQLPSVGPGNVLRDIITSGRVPVVRLNEIFRQAGESMIVVNAHKINRGEEPILNAKEKDFFFMNRNHALHVVETILELVKERLPKFTGCDPIKEMQILTPMRKSNIGMQNLNTELQKVLNPPGSNKAEKEFRDLLFREGDKVMQIKNNYNIKWEIQDVTGRPLEEGTGIFNGDVGTIIEIEEEDGTIKVLFEDERVVKYEASQLDELELAYAITIHKSQGSEFPVVIIPVFSGPPMLMTRNLLYTAVTRAKRYVVLVGKESMLTYMVDNNREINRYSSLHLRLRNAFDTL